MTDASSPTWAERFSDELLDFAHIPMDDVPDDPRKPLSPATRLVQAREKAAARAQRARDKAKRASELDQAIVQGLRSILKQRKVFERMRDGEALPGMAVRIEPILGEAMQVLVNDYGWDCTLASKALTAKLLRPAQPPAAKP